MVLKISNIKDDMLGVITTEFIQSKTLIRVFNPQYSDVRDKYTIQIGDKHMMDEIGQYLNHDCNPNSEIKDNKGVPCLYAIKDIDANDEITFNYNTTEEVLSNPFYCDCHNKLIKGVPHE